MKEMRGGVIAHRGFPDVGVDYGVDFLPDANRLLGDYLMCAYALDRRVAAGHLGDDRVVIVRVQPSAVADLASGLGVEGRFVKNQFALFSRFQRINPSSLANDR